MKQRGIRPKTVLLTLLGFIVLCAIGCDSQQQLASCRKQNKILTQRVTELEEQVKQADQAGASVETKKKPVVTGGSVYVVVLGDSLWSIAREQLGTGMRFPEILALNPHISSDEPMDIGTVLKMPPK